MSYFKLPHTAFVLGLLAGACALGSPAGAADLDVDPAYASVPAPIPQQQVTFGSGWYIRGDLAVTRLPAVAPTTAALGQAPEINFKPSSQLGYTASLGGGYAFTNYIRGDIIADFHEPVRSTVNGGAVYCPTSIYYTAGVRQTTNGGCTSKFSGNLQSYDVLANAYFDIGHWGLVTPYVGAGVGLAFGRYNTAAKYTQINGVAYDVTFSDPVTGATFHNNYDASASGNFYNFAFALMAGAAFDVYDHTKLDVGYRYLNQGKVGAVNLTSHEVHAGLRYMIDN